MEEIPFCSGFVLLKKNLKKNFRTSTVRLRLKVDFHNHDGFNFYPVRDSHSFGRTPKLWNQPKLNMSCHAWEGIPLCLKKNKLSSFSQVIRPDSGDPIINQNLTINLDLNSR